MEIKGLEDMSMYSLEQELNNGGKFVVYTFCISIIVMTFRRSSDIYYIKPGMGAIGPGWKFTLISLFLGWWGIPWGPIYTIGALITNLGGGRDVTQDVWNGFVEQQASRIQQQYV